MAGWTRGLGAAVACAAIIALGSALAGCGGGGASSNGHGGTGGSGGTTPKSATGVYRGTEKQTRAVGDTGTVELDMTQASGGASLSGTGRLTLNGQVYTGPITGAVTGANATFTVAYGTYGAVQYTVALSFSTTSGNTMTGTFTHTLPGGGTEGGTVTISQEIGTQTVTISGNYGGTYQDSASTDGPKQLSVTFVQNGNNLMVTGSANGDGFTGTGTIIGSSITYGTVSNGAGTATFTGAAIADEITGSYTATASDGSGDMTSGSWLVFKTR
ncbi:MAG TPA: hypothetical protein VKT77_23825 [Chthonomonadaceae bacterium]|nr:hypothetical protein [Chthonomonadaceae bacterium]